MNLQTLKRIRKENPTLQVIGDLTHVKKFQIEFKARLIGSIGECLNRTAFHYATSEANAIEKLYRLFELVSIQSIKVVK